MPHPGHARRTVRKDPSAKRLGKPPAKKKSLGIMGTAGMISAKALKGIKWTGSPQASKLMIDVAGPGGYRKKAATYVAKKVAPTVVKKAATKAVKESENIIEKAAAKGDQLAIKLLKEQKASTWYVKAFQPWRERQALKTAADKAARAKDKAAEIERIKTRYPKLRSR